MGGSRHVAAADEGVDQDSQQDRLGDHEAQQGGGDHEPHHPESATTDNGD
jgi:hypothetical protein